MLFNIDRMIATVDHCPWSAHAGLTVPSTHHLSRVASGHDDGAGPASGGTPEGGRPAVPPGLYTAEERARRDASPWTIVQGVLAPLQFAVFLVSLYLVVDYLVTGQGYGIAAASIVVKTIVLYVIMITGAIWEKEVFGRYLFAPAFYWEDVFSMLVLALHTAYLIALFGDFLSPVGLMVLALAAYATYVINAGQFVLKLRAARLQAAAADRAAAGPADTTR